MVGQEELKISKDVNVTEARFKDFQGDGGQWRYLRNKMKGELGTSGH